MGMHLGVDEWVILAEFKTLLRITYAVSGKTEIMSKKNIHIENKFIIIHINKMGIKDKNNNEYK